MNDLLIATISKISASFNGHCSAIVSEPDSNSKTVRTLAEFQSPSKPPQVIPQTSSSPEEAELQSLEVINQ